MTFRKLSSRERDSLKKENKSRRLTFFLKEPKLLIKKLSPSKKHAKKEKLIMH